MGKHLAAKDIAAIKAKLEGHAIVLVGLMGAGKSSVGRRLADRLGVAFVDADSEIEQAAGKTVAEIFADHGEPYFREGERKVISRLLEGGLQVLATGGGAFMNDETRANIRARGVSVWLRADLPLLMNRVQKRSTRPLLMTDDPEAVMQDLMAKRYPVYAEADITVDSHDVPHAEMVERVLLALKHWNMAETAESETP